MVKKGKKDGKRSRGRDLLMRVICISGLVVLLFGTAVIAGSAVYIDRNFLDEVDVSEYTVDQVAKETKLYYYNFKDRSNRIGEAELYGEKVGIAKNSVIVKYEDIPQNLINAFISIEDKRFFDHRGIDIRRTFGACINYILHHGDSYGGSTITQQVVKNITGNSEYSVTRKIQEMIYAADLERKMSKEEILELYLNIINLAHGNCGVGEAAEYYFSKSVSDLTLAECASLAAITSSPSNLDPENNPQNNLERRNMILGLMLDQGYITQDEFESATGAPTVLNISVNVGDETVNSWYVDMAIEDVINDLMKKFGYTYDKASRLVYYGGLNIYLAIDPEIQSVLERYYADSANFPVHNDGTTAESAAIVIDSQTGDILGVVGARGIKSANRIMSFASKAQRPTGSVIKPLSVYAPALDRDLINYASVFDDTPVSFVRDSTSNKKLRPWPYNYTFEYHGLTNINTAVKHSTNTVAVKVLQALGVENSYNFLTDKLKISGLIEDDKQVVSLALGQMYNGTTLRDISAAYSIFASEGYYNGYRSYYRVTDSDGRILLSNDTDPQMVIGSDTASIMTQILSEVVSSGTAHNVTLDGFIDCAAKTGTTENDCDKWMIGYTPYYICGVWYGYEYPRELTGLLRNPCVDIWDDIMTEAHQKFINGSDEVRRFTVDENVVTAEYCLDSGKIVTDACKKDARGDRTATGYFKKQTVPYLMCDRHILVPYDTENKGVAVFDCPYENIEYVGMIRVDRDFPMQIYIDDAEYVWKYVKNSEITADGHSAFFSGIIPEGRYVGISATAVQFNRACTHTADISRNGASASENGRKSDGGTAEEEKGEDEERDTDTPSSDPPKGFLDFFGTIRDRET